MGKLCTVLAPLLVLSLSALVSCNNILTPLGDPTTDEAILFEAQTNIDKSMWDEALVNLAKLSPNVASQRSVLQLKASAYAGRCGLSYVRLISSLGSMGNSKLLAFLMRSFSTATNSKIADCIEAEAVLNSITSDPALRTLDENLFLIFLSFAKIGTILHVTANTLGNTTPDPGFDACSTTSLSDVHAAQIASGLANALVTLTAVGASTTIGSGQATTITALCDALSGLPVMYSNYNFCTATDPNAVTAEQLKGVRSIIQENQYIGIGSCNNNLASCLCL